MWAGIFVVLMAAVCGTPAVDLNEPQLRDALTGASIELFKAATAGELKNNVLSPVSVNILLALLEQGSRGESSLQLQRALHLDHQQLREAYGRLSEDFTRTSSGDLQLDVANHVFVSEGFPVEADFLQTATRDFYSGVENVTFGSGDAGGKINAWVAEATRGKITNIVDPVMPAATVMVLANAVYFKSPWSKKFKKTYTQDNTFSVNPTKNVTVPFMFQEEGFLYGTNAELKVKWVELPFKGDNQSLLIILPDEQFGLADVLAKLTSAHVTSMLQEGSWNGVRVYLPRFTIGSKKKLIPALKELGVRDVFEAGRSDLSGISKEPLSVSNVLQKATMEIDEEGGVASAATVIEIVPLSAMVFLDPKELRANRPFIAMIVNKNGNMPLFMATVVDPSEA